MFSNYSMQPIPLLETAERLQRVWPQYRRLFQPAVVLPPEAKFHLSATDLCLQGVPPTRLQKQRLVMEHGSVFRPAMRGPRVRVLRVCFSVFLFLGGVGTDSTVTRAKHRAPEPTTAADPCATPEQFIKDHISQIKALQSAKKSSSDRFKTPDTVAAWLGLSQGQSPETETNAKKVAELRHEVDGIAELLRAQGCKAIDVDQEVKTPDNASNKK
jgi:hypothetical protein